MAKNILITATYVKNERGDTITLESLGYIAYNRDGAWVGVCEPFPSLTAPAETGSGALNAIKALVAATASQV